MSGKIIFVEITRKIVAYIKINWFKRGILIVIAADKNLN